MRKTSKMLAVLVAMVMVLGLVPGVAAGEDGPTPIHGPQRIVEGSMSFDPIPWESPGASNVARFWVHLTSMHENPDASMGNVLNTGELQTIGAAVFGPSAGELTYSHTADERAIFTEVGSDHFLGIRVYNYASSAVDMTFQPTVLTLELDGFGPLDIYLPEFELPSNFDGIYFWVASDGSTYYAHTSQTASRFAGAVYGDMVNLSPQEAIAGGYLAALAPVPPPRPTVVRPRPEPDLPPLPDPVPEVLAAIGVFVDEDEDTDDEPVPGVNLFAPAGTFPTGTIIYVTDEDDYPEVPEDQSHLVAASRVIEFEVEGPPGEPPVTGSFRVTILYDPDALEGVDAVEIQAMYWDDALGKWLPLPRLSLNPATGEIEFEVPGTRVAVMGVPGWQELTDIAGHEHELAILAMNALGAAGDCPEGIFRPDDYATRADLLSMLENLPDVRMESVYRHTATLAETGLVQRHEVAGQTGRALLLPMRVGFPDVTDVRDVPAPSRRGVTFMVENGIMEPFADGTFRPFELVTRGELCMILLEALRLR